MAPRLYEPEVVELAGFQFQAKPQTPRKFVCDLLHDFTLTSQPLDQKVPQLDEIPTLESSFDEPPQIDNLETQFIDEDLSNAQQWLVGVPSLEDIPPLDATHADDYRSSIEPTMQASEENDDRETVESHEFDTNASESSLPRYHDPLLEVRSGGFNGDSMNLVPIQECERVSATSLDGLDPTALRRHRNMLAARRSRARRRNNAISELSAINEQLMKENESLKGDNALLRQLLASKSGNMNCD